MNEQPIADKRPQADQPPAGQSIRIRLANPSADFAPIAHLLSAYTSERTDAQDLLDEHSVQMDGRSLRHAVAVTSSGEVVGYNFAGHYPSMETNQYYVNIVVDPAYRHRGVGTQLWHDLAGYLRGQAADSLLAHVLENDPVSYRFAEERGFAIRVHEVQAVLGLDSYDAHRFDGLVEALETEGIRIASFADVAQTEANIRQLYDINGVAALDDPASDGAYIGYENWKKVIFAASWFQPEGQMLALDGDTFIGLSAITYDKEERMGRTLISGVAAEHRNRKIMQALKSRAIDYVRTQGATQVLTEFGAANAPMRAINRKLGFRELPGKYEMAAAFG